MASSSCLFSTYLNIKYYILRVMSLVIKCLILLDSFPLCYFFFSRINVTTYIFKFLCQLKPTAVKKIGQALKAAGNSRNPAGRSSSRSIQSSRRVTVCQVNQTEGTALGACAHLGVISGKAATYKHQRIGLWTFGEG